MKNKILTAVLIIFLCAGTLYAATGVATPAATVNLIKTTIISTSELEEKTAYYTNLGYTVTALEVLQTMINEELLKQGMERDGYLLTEEQKDQLLAAERSSLDSQVGRALTDEEFESVVYSQTGMSSAQYREYAALSYSMQWYVTDTKGSMFSEEALTPTDKEVETYYRRNQGSFANSEAVKVAMVVKEKTGDSSVDAGKLSELRTALSRIKAGTLTFEKAVNTYSEDSLSKAQNGVVGWLPIDNESYLALFGEDLYDAAFSLEDGEIYDTVLDSNIGYVILKVVQHTYFNIPGLDDTLSPAQTKTVRESIVETQMQNKANEIYSQGLEQIAAELYAQAKVNILYQGTN